MSKDSVHLVPIKPDPSGPFSLLNGVRVLDLTTSIAGPSSTMLLGDFGAEVIKIERPGTGDDCRAWGPPFLDGVSLWYLSMNRNKQSVTLDYASPEGYEVLCDLVRHCDVIVLNMPIRVQNKLRLDYETLKNVKADLVHASITGFGLEGARKDRTCYDLIAEGYSGVMDLTGEPDSPPQKVGTPAADMLAGQDTAMAILAALYERRGSGQGRQLDISLVESMSRFMSCRIVPYMGTGEVPARSGGRDSVIAIYQAFDTADAPVTLGLGNDGIWKRFWAAVGQPGYAERPEFASNADRRKHRSEIVDYIQALLKTKGRDHWLQLLADARVPSGPINTVMDLVEDEALSDRRFLFEIDDDERRVPQVGLGIQVDGKPSLPASIPPRLGENSNSVLRDLLGYPEDRINELKSRGTV